MPMAIDYDDRIYGALCLAGMGDALGAQTEQWTQAEIRHVHRGLVMQFGTPPPDTFAGALAGQKAEVTDDASQMYHLARALVAAGGRLDAAGWVACLLDWAATSPKAGFMGPSTLGIVRALQAGEDVAKVGVIGRSARKMSTVGNTNGAAMRVAPCGLLHPGNLQAACEQAFVTCLPSHDTDVAVSAACAIAAGCAQALVGQPLDRVIAACLQGAQMGEDMARERVRSVAGPSMVARTEMALEIAAAASDDWAFLQELERKVGNSVLAAESVPAALAVLAYARGDPLRTIALASSVGNDTDSIATMAGAIAGAMHGAHRLPAALLGEFLQVNGAEYGIQAMAQGMAAIAQRHARAE